VQLWGITGVQKEVVLASQRSLVTVEEIVDELELRPGGVVLPGWTIDAVAVAPGGARPSYAHGYYERDNAAYLDWEKTSRDREAFTAWLRELDKGEVDKGELHKGELHKGDLAKGSR
jgi:glutaconate CoA-transferase subunit A